MNSKRKMIIFIICYIAYTMIYIARLNLSVASPSIIENQILDTAGIGMLGSIFSVVYAAGRLINGYISDKKPPQYMIAIGLAVVGISNLVIGTVPNAVGLALLWGCNAYAQSMLWGPILKIVAGLYDEKTAKKKTSYMVTSVAAGNIIGILLNTVIINQLGFRFAFIIPGIMTLVFCTVIIFAMHGTEKSVNTAQKKHMAMLALCKDYRIKRVIVPAWLHGMIKDNISVWMTVFFVDKYGINLSQSAGFVLFIPIVGFVGRMIYPACYKLCKAQEHRVSVYAFAICVIASAIMCITDIPPVGAAVCLSIIYASVSVVNTSILSIFPLQFADTDNVASVSGIMDFATYFGAGVSSLAYGYIIKYFGYMPMYLSWVLVSLASVLILRPMLSESKK